MLALMAAMADESAPGTEQVVRATPSPTLANDWSLVLASAGIAHRLVEGGGAFSLVVRVGDAASAAAALAAYDAESVPRVVPPAPDSGPSALGIFTGIALLAMFYVTGAGDARAPTAWFAAGVADAAKILGGEWWRAVTALTLHADISHVVLNVLANLLFVTAVGRWLGGGLGASLIVACAAVANVLTALWHRHDAHFVSLGASTATFAALGLVSGLQLYRRWRYDERRRYFWLPLGGGLALFAMLGTAGERPDIGAHLFGLLVGAVTGTAVAASGLRAPGRVGQALLTVVVSAVLVGAWLLAFRASGLAPP
jgi:membrane associated rhomboid family serine protease